MPTGIARRPSIKELHSGDRTNVFADDAGSVRGKGNLVQHDIPAMDVPGAVLAARGTPRYRSFCRIFTFV